MLSRTFIKKQPGRRWLKYFAAAGLLVATLVVAGIALAVHDLAFQLDGNTAVDSPAPFIGGVNHQTADWETFFDNSGTGGIMKKIPGALSTTGTGFTADAFAVDFKTAVGRKGGVVFDTSDNSTYATGSKDTLDINPGWQCSAANNLLSKNDIMNAYTAAYTDPKTGHQILYFALERNNNNGDANVGFWFLQGSASCDTQNGTVTGSWQGHHTDGDILIVSAFTNGGGVSGITAYKWSTALGTVDPHPVGNGGDCQGASGLDAICATTNGSASPGLNAAITTKWLTAAGTSVGHTLQPSEFFEGGIDLTSEHLDNKCFNTFVGDTRSSQSLTATIFDYALGTLGECSATMTTKPSSGSIAIGSSITDSATITVKASSATPPAPTGTVKFYVCGPSASLATCDATGNNFSNVNLSTATVASPDYTVTSGSFTPTAAGDYCFFSSWVGDTNYTAGASHDSADECFTVTPAQPKVVTQVNDAGPVIPGTELYDTATLSNAATPSNGVQGTIKFSAYGPAANLTTCTAPALYTATVTVTGNGSFASNTSPNAAFKPNLQGFYNWIAAYTPGAGDVNNKSFTTTCGDANEGSVVIQHPTTTVTDPESPAGVPNTSVSLGALVYDHAIVTNSDDSGTGSPTGTVDFYICNPSQVTGSGATAHCAGTGGTGDGTLVNSVTPLTAGPGTDQSEATSSAVTASLAVPADALGVWCFRATYTPDVFTFIGSSDSTNDECFTVTTTSSGTTAQKWLPNDHVVVSTPIGSIAGTLSVQLLEGGTCNSDGSVTGGVVKYTEPVPGGGAFTATAAGAPYNTTNSTFFVTTLNPDTYVWHTVFTPTSTFATGFQKCETSTVSPVNDTP